MNTKDIHYGIRYDSQLKAQIRKTVKSFNAKIQLLKVLVRSIKLGLKQV